MNILIKSMKSTIKQVEKKKEKIGIQLNEIETKKAELTKEYDALVACQKDFEEKLVELESKNL